LFFTISLNKDPRLPNHTLINEWYFSYDDGWVKTNNRWFKGYHQPNVDHGNYVEIINSNSNIRIVHDRYRSFPMWWDESTATLTNLLGQGKSIYADDLVQLTNRGIEIVKQDYCDTISQDTIFLDQAVEKIEKNLVNKAIDLETNYSDLPKKLFVSGGVDTLMLYALIKQQNLPVEVVDYEHMEYDWFLNHNLDEIRSQHWAYNQIHHWKTSTMLITGACGDEFLFRGPYTIALWAAWHDIEIEKYIKTSTGYHAKHFLKEKNIAVFQEFYKNRKQVQEQYVTKLELIRQILDVNANDHQHWHVGNTITWTPLKDLELTKIMLQLSVDDLMQQILDAKVNKMLMERFYPESLRFLSKSKNYRSRDNLHLLK
jgi:hypothetical protein